MWKYAVLFASVACARPRPLRLDAISRGGGKKSEDGAWPRVLLRVKVCLSVPRVTSRFCRCDLWAVHRHRFGHDVQLRGRVLPASFGFSRRSLWGAARARAETPLRSRVP